MREYVTVVSGLPRSGTSLMMQMLAAGGMPVLTDGARGADVDNPHGYLEFDAVKRLRHDKTWVSETVGKAVKIVYPLLRELPATYTYRVIAMRRNLKEVVASQSAMLLRTEREGADVNDERLVAILEIEVRRTMEWLRAQTNFSVMEVDYSECLGAPASVAARAGAFLGGGLDVEAMAGAVDGGLYRQKG